MLGVLEQVLNRTSNPPSPTDIYEDACRTVVEEPWDGACAASRDDGYTRSHGLGHTHTKCLFT